MTAKPMWDRTPGWTPARVELLRRHHAMGMTTAESADALGGVSRNAVLCKRLRLGLTSRPRDAESALSRLLAGQRFPEPEPPPLPCLPLPAADYAPPRGAKPKLLVDRGPRECAWPLGPVSQPGDHRTLCCCAPTLRRRSYCAVHDDIARRAP